MRSNSQPQDQGRSSAKLEQPNDALSNANLNTLKVNSELELTLVNFPNILKVEGFEQIRRALANPNINATLLELEPCRYTDLVNHLETIHFIQKENKQEFSYNASSKRRFDDALNGYIDLLIAGKIPADLLESFKTDIAFHRKQAIQILGDNDPSFQILVKGIGSSSDFHGKPLYDPWHVDWDTSQVYLWTPLSEYEHATEGTSDTNAIRSILWQAWQEGGAGLLNDSNNFLYDSTQIVKVPNNTLSVFLGEIPETHQAQFKDELGSNSNFNQDKGFLHRSPGMEPGKWRLVVRFFSSKIPEHLQGKLS